MSVPVQTLLYVFCDDQEAGRQVLLGRKVRGFGSGLVMAPGGHVEPGESVVSAAVREAQDEVGITVSESDVDRIAVLTYRFPSRPELDAGDHQPVGCPVGPSGTVARQGPSRAVLASTQCRNPHRSLK